MRGRSRRSSGPRASSVGGIGRPRRRGPGRTSPCGARAAPPARRRACGRSRLGLLEQCEGEGVATARDDEVARLEAAPIPTGSSDSLVSGATEHRLAPSSATTSVGAALGAQPLDQRRGHALTQVPAIGQHPHGHQGDRPLDFAEAADLSASRRESTPRSQRRQHATRSASCRGPGPMVEWLRVGLAFARSAASSPEELERQRVARPTATPICCTARTAAGCRSCRCRAPGSRSTSAAAWPPRSRCTGTRRCRPCTPRSSAWATTGS